MFHAVLSEIWPNNRLAPLGLAPPPEILDPPLIRNRLNIHFACRYDLVVAVSCALLLANPRGFQGGAPLSRFRFFHFYAVFRIKLAK